MLTKIVSNKKIKKNFFLIELESPNIAEKAAPGNFIMIKTGDCYDPLLKRPMSIHDSLPDIGIVKVLYQVIGKGTKLLSQKKTGKTIDILGPLGNSFSINLNNKTSFMVAGGIGIAPFTFLAKSILKVNKNSRIILFVGGKKREDILPVNDFENFGCKLQIVTEDGSFGEKGLITEPLNNYFKKNTSPGIIYACGPTGMLHGIHKIAEKYKVKCQISLDKPMACGVGVCLGCVVLIKDEMTKVVTKKCICKDGPIFNSIDLVW